MPTKLLLADDHELFLSGILSLLDEAKDLEVIGVAKDGREAFKKARELEPDLVLMDLSMPGLNGIEATRQVTREIGTKVVCLSMHAEARLVEAALKAGASGYLVKDCDIEELLRGIRVVAKGGTFLSPQVTATVVEALKTDRELESASAFVVLTDREREVLQLLAEGRTTREIAGDLNMSIKTVHTHREHLMEKLHIHSIAGLTKYAILEGLTSEEPEYSPEH